MAERTETGEAQGHDVVCPHCHREFTPALIGAGEQQGYKCPHCRLFVPQERAEEADGDGDA